MTGEETVATFFTTHSALRAEKLLKSEGVAARLIPTPRYVSADCTLSLAFSASDHQRVRAVLEGQGVEVHEFHELRDEQT